MAGLLRDRGVCLGLILAGSGLASVAMFLHPMSPEDFLGLALTDPLQTVADTHGGALALLFWGGILVGIAGVGGFALRIVAALRRSLHLNANHHLPAH